MNKNSTPARSPSIEPKRPFPLVTGIARVCATTRLTPRLSRITLTDPSFEELPVEEPGEVITLLWPEEGHELVLPEVGWRFPPGVADRQHARNYTVRSWTPGAVEINIDFVIHGDDGRASRWAAAASPGDQVGFAASRTHWVGDIEADWILLVADETGLPALAAVLETLPAGVPVLAVIEVAGSSDEIELETGADLNVTWLHRGNQPPGTSSALLETIAGMRLPSGDGVAWGGAEALAMRDVRRHLRGECGMENTATRLLGYWKHALTRGWD